MVPGVPDQEGATSARLRAERLVATEIYGIPTGVTHPDQELFEIPPKKNTGEKKKKRKTKTMKEENGHLLKYSPVYIHHTVILLNTHNSPHNFGCPWRPEVN